MRIYREVLAFADSDSGFFLATCFGRGIPTARHERSSVTAYLLTYQSYV